MAACGRSAADPRPVADAREALNAGIPAEVSSALDELKGPPVFILPNKQGGCDLYVAELDPSLDVLSAFGDELPFPHRAAFKEALEQFADFYRPMKHHSVWWDDFIAERHGGKAPENLTDEEVETDLAWLRQRSEAYAAFAEQILDKAWRIVVAASRRPSPSTSGSWPRSTSVTVSSRHSRAPGEKRARARPPHRRSSSQRTEGGAGSR